MDSCDSEYKIKKSYTLEPHNGYEETQQNYYNRPSWLEDNKIIYSNSKDNKYSTYIYDLNSSELVVFKGELLGVSYKGNMFIVSNVIDTVENNKIDIYNSSLELVKSLQDIVFLKDTFIYNDILISMYLWEPGFIPFMGTPFLIYDLKNNENIIYEKEFDLLNNGNVHDFLGFYE